MFRRRGEPVPFTFIAEADRFRSNVAPPRPPRRGGRQRAGSALLGLTIVSALAGALLLGLPALDAGRQSSGGDRPSTAEGR